MYLWCIQLLLWHGLALLARVIHGHEAWGQKLHLAFQIEIPYLQILGVATNIRIRCLSRSHACCCHTTIFLCAVHNFIRWLDLSLFCRQIAPVIVKFTCSWPQNVPLRNGRNHIGALRLIEVTDLWEMINIVPIFNICCITWFERLSHYYRNFKCILILESLVQLWIKPGTHGICCILMWRWSNCQWCIFTSSQFLKLHSDFGWNVAFGPFGTWLVRSLLASLTCTSLVCSTCQEHFLFILI